MSTMHAPKRPVLARLVGGPAHGRHFELPEFLWDIRVNVEDPQEAIFATEERPYPEVPFWHHVAVYSYSREHGVWVYHGE